VHGAAPPNKPICTDHPPVSAAATAAVPCHVLRDLPFATPTSTDTTTPLRALLLAVTADDLDALPVFFEAARRIQIGAPLLVAPLDAAAAAALSKTDPTSLPTGAHVLEPATWRDGRATAGADRHAALAIAFDLWRSLLMAGVGTMLLSPRVVLLRDQPLRYDHQPNAATVACALTLMVPCVR
jgi:hypothetical protein